MDNALYRACKAEKAPAYHEAVLSRWGLIKKVKLGRESYKGHALFVSNGPEFRVESRGVEVSGDRCKSFPFVRSDRASRAAAFKLALNDFSRRISHG